MNRKEEHNREQAAFTGCAFTFCVMLAILFIALLVAGCSPKAWEQLHQAQRDSVMVVQHDSIRFYDRDSIYIKEKGDTVYQYVERWRWRDRWRVDTLIKVRVDSVAVEVVREVAVEKTLTGWQRFRLSAFPWLVMAVVLLLIWAFRKLIFKL